MKLKCLIGALTVAALPFAAQADVDLQFGPYLVNPAPDAISIGFVTPDKATSGGAIDYRIKGETEFKRVYDAEVGQIIFNRNNHLVHLKDLKPGAAYEYKVVTMDPKKYTFAESDSIFTFTTLDPAKKNHKFVLCSDIHNKPETFRHLMKLADAKSADFIVLDGDLAGAITYISSDIIKPCIQPATEMFGGSMPLVPVRGNHEYRGGKSNSWVDYVGTSDRKTYCAFTHGDAFYIVLDAGEDKLDRTPKANYTFFNHSEPYFKEQKEWLEKVVKSDAFKKAKFRIVLTHIATHGQPDAFPQKRMREYFGKLLNGKSKDNRIHLMLAGHEHRYLRVDAGSTKSKVFRMDKMLSGKDFNYTVVSNDGPGWGGVESSVMIIEVTPDKLNVTTLNGEKDEPVELDKFSIDQNGKVSDLMKVDAIDI